MLSKARQNLQRIVISHLSADTRSEQGAKELLYTDTLSKEPMNYLENYFCIRMLLSPPIFHN
ncbi:hypothetical protein LINPERHAP2_LOCUS43137, partial [Linum perenne]